MKTTTTPKAGERTHTPGPWKKGATHCNPRARCFKTSIFSGLDIVAETVTFFDGGRFITPHSSDQARLNSLANATLVAAAPELLKSLQEYIAAVDAYYRNPGTDDTGEKCAELVLVHERAIAIIAKAETPR